MATSAREFTIFYAWQSDTPKQNNRHLIEIALKEACERLGDDDAIPYTITVTSDTKGVPGLCDIPAAILAKIDAADAVVLDLTYIAHTRRRPAKYCPNPNVLFELGYAFHAVGSERLICVMNEHHGLATEILFDIGHRRHPVRYVAPLEGKSRKQVMSELTDALVDALKPTVMLGPRSIGIDTAQAFELESNQIRQHWESTTQEESGPRVFLSVRPTRFDERRWPDAITLERLVREHTVAAISGVGPLPPSERYTDVMPWGIYNGAYACPTWSFSYAGQFWATRRISANVDYKFTDFDRSVDIAVRDRTVVPSQEWIDYPYAKIDIADMFRCAASLANAFHPNEQLVWSAIATGLGGTILASSRFESMRTCSRMCASPSAHRGGTATAGEFSSEWTTACMDFLCEMLQMYEALGQRISRSSLEQWMATLVGGRRR